MKVEIPEQLKADVPANKWGKILAGTPVVMAVVATMLAGLSSSEMTRAQYDRALAAQQQSKAGDQWGFFQAKRLRGALQRNSLDLLQSTAAVHPLAPEALNSILGARAAEGEPSEASKAKAELLALLRSQTGRQALGRLLEGEPPRGDSAPALEPGVRSALDALESSKPEPDIATLLARVNNQSLDAALRAARDQVQAFDTATGPLNRTIDQFENLLRRSGVADASLNRDFTAARMRYAAQRYEIEARLNQSIANLYELQVRKSNVSAERHHNRSQRFFYGMLAAQLGVIVSTFAMAARKRNVLWAIAAAAGLVAIAFAVYVYLCV